MRHIGACDWEITAHWSNMYSNNDYEDYGVYVVVIASQLRLCPPKKEVYVLFKVLLWLSQIVFVLTFFCSIILTAWFDTYQEKREIRAELEFENPFVTSDFNMV